MIRSSRARHKKEDIRIVEATFGVNSITSKQHRLMQDCWRSHLVGDGADMTLSSTPFDIIYARRLSGANGLVLNVDHQSAAMWFLRLYHYRNGRCDRLRGCLDFGGLSGDVNADNARRDAEALACMGDPRLSAADRDMLVDVVAFGRMPRWLAYLIAGRSYSVREQHEFIAAVETLRLIWIDFDDDTTESLRWRYARRRQNGNR